MRWKKSLCFQVWKHIIYSNMDSTLRAIYQEGLQQKVDGQACKMSSTSLFRSTFPYAWRPLECLRLDVACSYSWRVCVLTQICFGFSSVTLLLLMHFSTSTSSRFIIIRPLAVTHSRENTMWPPAIFFSLPKHDGGWKKMIK